MKTKLMCLCGLALLLAGQVCAQPAPTWWRDQAGLPWGFPNLNAPSQTLTTEQWRADLQALAEQLPLRHLNAFHTIAREAWLREVAALDAELPNLPDHVIVVRLTRLVQLIGDLHTSVNWLTGVRPFRRYPIFLFNRADGLYVQAVESGARLTNRGWLTNRFAIGARLVQVGDFDIAAVKERLLPFISTDVGNQAWPDWYWPELLVTPEILHAVGVTPTLEQARFVVEDQTGVRFEFTLPAVERSQFGQLSLLAWPWLRRWQRPLFITRASSVYYWGEYLPAERAYYVRYRQCTEMPGQPFAAFMQEAFETIQANDVRRIILDLRDNTGGSSAILDPAIGALKETPFNRRGALYVLINQGTASSAVLNANRLQHETEAILVGETAGNNPKHYGNVATFNLPNSQLRVNYSTRYFDLPIRTTNTLSPDVTITYPWADFAAGRDPVLDYALRN